MKIFKLFIIGMSLLATALLSGCTELYTYDSGYYPAYPRTTIVRHDYPYYPYPNYPRHPHVRPVPPPPYPGPHPHVRPIPPPPFPGPHPHVRPVPPPVPRPGQFDRSHW
jgi:hypothetical protein